MPLPPTDTPILSDELKQQIAEEATFLARTPGGGLYSGLLKEAKAALERIALLAIREEQRRRETENQKT